jgi:hypothetical protein
MLETHDVRELGGSDREGRNIPHTSSWMLPRKAEVIAFAERKSESFNVVRADGSPLLDISPSRASESQIQGLDGLQPLPVSPHSRAEQFCILSSPPIIRTRT